MLRIAILSWAVLTLLCAVGFIVLLVRGRVPKTRAVALTFAGAPLVPGCFLLAPRLLGLTQLGAPFDAQWGALLMCALGVPLGALAFAESARRLRPGAAGGTVELVRLAAVSSWTLASGVTVVGFVYT